MRCQPIVGTTPGGFAASIIAAYAVVYLKFFSKNPDLQKAVATLIENRMNRADLGSVPTDLKRAVSRALSKAK